MCRHLAILLFLVAISCRTGNAQDSKAPYTISRETTRITEPVSDDGLIDYIEALSRRQREGVTPDNNCVVLFRRAFGHRDLSAEATAEYFDQLGMDALPKEGDYLIGTQEYVASLSVSELPKGDASEAEARQLVLEQHGQASSRPWKRAEFPLVARWIDTNEKPLALIVQGSHRPKYFAPLVPSKGMVLAILLPDVQNSRELARLLSTRAMLKLGEGDVEAAWLDLMACHRIARLIAQGPTIIEVLVGIGIESIACQSDSHIAQSGLSAEQAQRFANELRALGFVSGSADRIDVGERFTYLDAAGKVAVYGIDLLEAITDSDEKNEVAPRSVRQAILNGLVDWDVVTRMGNEMYDRIVKAGRLSTRLERQPEFEKLNAELEQMSVEAAENVDLAKPKGVRPAVSRKFGLILIRLMVPAVTQVFEAEDRCFMRTELSQCAFALAAWRADHKSYPDQLELLTPKYLPGTPIDIYTEKPLIYRRSDSGYLLYGIGKNLRDDGSFTFGEGTDTDDLVVRTPDEVQRIKAAAEKLKSGN